MFAQRIQLNPLKALIATTILLTIISQTFCRSTSDQTTGAATDIIARKTQDSSALDAAAASVVAPTAVDSPDDDQFISSSILQEPRQYFKIHITPSAQQNGNFKRAALKEAAIKRSGHLVSSDTTTTYHQNHHNSHETGGKQKISNATLKKLLNQSLLLKNSNGSLAGAAAGSPKASNFKFMFIQRATPKSTNSNKEQTTTQSHSNSKDSTTTNTPVESQPNSAASSLAASVSKHLASTLLSSASDIVANLSSVPSLTSLATQIVVQSMDHHQQRKSSSSSNQQPNKSNSSSSEYYLNHLTEAGKKIPAVLMRGDKKKQGSSQNGKPRPPSKIYNLPVKFVANGQPNHVVINTIRKHFATIKKLQAERQKFAIHTGEQGNSNSKRNNNKNRHQQTHKLKGNSRFIYLPLKYLSNARPTRVLVSSSKTVTSS